MASNSRNDNILLRLIEISKWFSGKRILDEITVSIYAKESVAIVGPNGSGKSTLVRLISGLIPATKGTREVSAEPIIRIGYVPDRFPILRFTAKEYLLDMGRLQGIPLAVLEKRVQELLTFFTLDFAGNQRMTGFSKGMLQKVNLMQAILEEPDLLVLDEPLSGLDQDSQREFVSLLLGLKRKGIALVIVCHESLVLETIADRIITLNKGRIVDDHLSKSQHPTEIVMIEAKFKHSSDANEIGYRDGILDVDTHNGVSTIRMDAAVSNDVLRAILQMNASILSLNPVQGDYRLHFRCGNTRKEEAVEQ